MKLPLHIRELNRATEYFNPLRGLDIPRVVRLLDEGECGRYAELQKLNAKAEKRHPVLRALKHNKLAALKNLQWDVKTPKTLPDGITPAQAEAQRVLLRSRYEAIENLPQAIGFLALAEFRGFAHLEPHYQDNNPALPVIRLQPVPQWHWLRSREDFAWRYDAAARGNESDAVSVDPADFIIREVEDPLCEIALLCFVRRNFGKKNWTVFQADYAIPSIFASLSENTPIDKVKEWLALVREVTNNSRGALPPGSEAKALDVGDRDGSQFDNFIQAEDKDLVLAGTGGHLTMLAQSTGMNDAQGNVQSGIFAALAQAEAADISALLQSQFDKRILAVEFPSQPPVAYFELAAEDREDVNALADRAVKFSSAGLELDEQELSERVGMKLRKKAVAAAPADSVGAYPQAAFGNRAVHAGGFRNSAPATPTTPLATLLAAASKDLAPVRGRIEAIIRLVESGKDAAAFAALDRLKTEIPTLLAPSHLTAALTESLAQAARQGAATIDQP